MKFCSYYPIVILSVKKTFSPLFADAVRIHYEQEKNGIGIIRSITIPLDSVLCDYGRSDLESDQLRIRHKIIRGFLVSSRTFDNHFRGLFNKKVENPFLKFLGFK